MTTTQPPIPPNTFELRVEIRSPDGQVTGARIHVSEQQLISFGPKETLHEGFKRLATQVTNHVMPDEDETQLQMLDRINRVNLNAKIDTAINPIWQAPVGGAPALDPDKVLREMDNKNA